MKIAIVGAGIGGLATALSLEAVGITDIHLYERVPEIQGLGVGINLLPHAMRELTELGLAERVASLGVPPSMLGYYNRHGQLIWREPRGIEAGYRWPQMSVHRGKLQLALRDAVLERLGEVISLGHKLISITPGAQTDTARFATASGTLEVDADLIIGADGIHSAMRSLRYPDEGAPEWSGLTLWRGTAVAPSYLDGKTMIMVGDEEQKFVSYPLQTPTADGTSVINFIAERRGEGAGEAEWNRSIDPAPIVELFEKWRFDWLDVPAIIASATEVLEYPMVDRNALPQWSFGRTTLLGDAAHAMYPNGSNGASQAIIDARTLAYHLATEPSIPDALDAYESARRPATAKLLEMTRKTGPELVMTLAHERAPEGFDALSDVFADNELEDIATSYKQAAGFHPDTLNARTSLTPGQQP